MSVDIQVYICKLVKIISSEMQIFLLIIFHDLSIGYCLDLFGFTLYHIDHLLNGLDRDCLYYFVPEVGFTYQFIQYCIHFQLKKEVFDYKH